MSGAADVDASVWSVWRWALSWRALLAAGAAVVALWGGGALFDALRGTPGRARLSGEVTPVGAFDLVSLSFLMRDGASVAETPAALIFVPKAWEALFVEAPLSASVLMLLLTAIAGVGAMGVARLAALRTAGDVVGDWHEMGAGLRRVESVTSGLAFILGAIMGGWLLWSVGGVVAIAVGVLAWWCVMGVAWCVAVGAFACEGSDGADAQQRTLAYLVARPVHTALLTLAIAAQFAIACALVLGLGSLAARVAPDSVAIDAIVRGLIALLAIAFAGAGGAVAYLRLRSATDGQRMGDVWTPEGLASGTFSRTATREDD